jgi:hypothetical protein
MPHITRWGQDFEVAEKFGYYELITFARIAKGSDEDLDELDQILAVETVLKECFAPDVYPVFEAAARAAHADLNDLMDVMKDAIGVIAENPTKSPSDSSDGQTTTPGKSLGDSSSRALALVEGRPDLQYMIVQAQQAQTG